MLRFLTDEDFDGRLINALIIRVPGLDLQRAQDVGLMETPDPEILEWASGGRIILTHDRNTMTGFAISRIEAGLAMAGLFVVDRGGLFGRVLDDLEVLAMASNMDEWRDRVLFIPL